MLTWKLLGFPIADEKLLIGKVVVCNSFSVNGVKKRL